MSFGSRPVIGLLASSTVEPWAVRQWEGVVEAARDLDVELVSYIGGVLRSARFDEQANVMYDLAACARVDGFVVWATALGWLIPRSELVEFLGRFREKPMVSLEMRFPGMPSVLMDDYGGMRAVIDHLIEDHGRRRIAFIRGPVTHEGCEERYRGYRDSLAAHGLPWDPGLESPPSPDIDGAGAIRAILDSRGPMIDAVAGADDLLAIAALPALAGRGLRVPEDVAVAGFDDMPEDMTTSPPLASADPPFKAMGRRAMEMIVDLIEGRPVPESETMPIGLSKRRSCGCHGTAEATEDPSARPISPRRGRATVVEGWASVAELLREEESEADVDSLRALWEEFAAEARGGESGAFVASFERWLEEDAGSGVDPIGLFRLLAVMQRASFAWSEGLPRDDRLRAGELWCRIQGLAAEAIRKRIVQRQVTFGARHAVLRRLSERLGSVYDVDGQMKIVAQHLPRLGIPSCYVSIFDRPEEPTGSARLVLAYGRNGRIASPPEGMLFSAPELVPVLPESAAPGRSRLALALFQDQTRFGFVVFEIERKDDALICELLRWQISVALKGAADIRAEKAAASEKAALLRELQHRVKNSMSLIAGIAGIKSREASNPETQAALADLRTRIVAVGELYEALFDSGNIEHIDLSDYLVRVVETASESIGSEPGRIAFDRSLVRCEIDLKRAVSLGLIVNELVTDSIKHAFPDGRKGRIGIRLAQEGDEIVLEIRDDGVGFPPGFDPGKAEGFGLRMVSLLAEQLRGILAFESDDSGARTTLRLPARASPASER